MIYKQSNLIYLFTRRRLFTNTLRMPFESLNEELRKTNGNKITNFGKLLDKCLAKLPNFEDIVYRGVNLTTKELNRYIDAYNENLNIIECQFLSSSISKAEAHRYGDTLFRIFSKTGKSIEALSKYPNEKEVVFRYKTVFEVLMIDFNEDTKKYSITMEEM